MTTPSADMLKQFKNAIKLPATCPEAVLGDQSWLSRLLQASGTNFSAAEALEAVQSVKPTAPALMTCYAHQGHAAEAEALLTALRALLETVQLVAASDSNAHNTLRAAIAALDEAYGAGEPTVTHPARPVPDQHAPHPVDQLFANVGELHCTNRAYWMAYDLLCDWSPPASGPARGKPQTATISILGALASGLMRLEVDLYPCQEGCFAPDPRCLGLTSIRRDHETDQCLLRSMDRIWRYAGLSAQWRGRWRIVHPPVEDRPENARVNHLGAYHGRSAEAAALCALLAATRDPYHLGWANSPRETPIDLKMAISATVKPVESAAQAPAGGGGTGQTTPVASARPILQAKLGPVTGITGKLAAAHPVIDTVLFAPGIVAGSPSPAARQEVDQLLEDEQQAIAQKTVYEKLRVAEVATVIDALDRVLVTNRHLRAFQQAQRETWLKQWIDDTGRHPTLDPDPWPTTPS